ncbi:hypothetical protein PHSC3_001529 [Chlamydiales bacterium STE3]|nr:hypothetical protein PHSC3_001529 [Chlamydiales bacterium STE3]
MVPETASLIAIDGKETRVSLKEVYVGDHLLIRPGEKIPADGRVIEGQSWVNESMITGESIPVPKKLSDPLIGGTINEDRALLMKVEKAGSNTLLARIINLVVNARSSRAPIQRLADRVSQVFVPVVISVALATFMIWQLLGFSVEIAIEHAVAVLIIACPCALGLATPLSMMLGLGKGALNGVLVKNGEAIELMEKVQQLVIDKTG